MGQPAGSYFTTCGSGSFAAAAESGFAGPRIEQFADYSNPTCEGIGRVMTVYAQGQCISSGLGSITIFCDANNSQIASTYYQSSDCSGAGTPNVTYPYGCLNGSLNNAPGPFRFSCPLGE
jgi:hypothetical protein